MSELRALAQTVLDGLAADGYTIEQLEDDARRLAEAALAETTTTTTTEGATR